MKNLLKQGINKLFSTGFFHIFGSNVINKILGFISSVFIVRLLSKYDYGIYTSGLNIFSFFMMLSCIGMISGVLQLCSENARNLDKNYSIYSYGSRIGILFNVFLGLIILLSSVVFTFPIKGTEQILMMLALIPVFEGTIEFQKTYFRSRLENKSFSYANTINSFFVVLCSVVGAFIYEVNGLIIGRYLAAFITIAIIKIYLKGPIAVKSAHIEKDDKEALWKISLISMINGGLSQLLYLVDIFFIGLLVKDSVAVADYKIAIIIPTALAFIPASICIYIYPYFSLNKDNKEWVAKYYKLTMILMGGLNLFISIFLIVFAPIIIKILFGDQYMSSIGMFRISAASYFFLGTFRTISGNLLVTQRKLKFNLIASIITGVANVLSNYVLINIMGAQGAAWTTLFVSCLSGCALTGYMIYVINNIDSKDNA
ncbi:MAG: oligosaccharide flippase family protein [Clostridiales bacterium]|nr:oligosaccharide flippase family protein [Clostridiales bacterium]MDY6117238.1 oligosaccharide flippase family protein [Anaerovoracaceae bacterium]